MEINVPESIYAEGNSYKVLQDQVTKITEIQRDIISKYEVISKGVEEMRRTISQFSLKIDFLQEDSKESKNFKSKMESQLMHLHTRMDELYTSHKAKDGAYEESVKPYLNRGTRSESVYSLNSTGSELSTRSRVAMATGLDRDEIRAAYEDVRSDASPTEWAVFKFDGARIVCSARGSDFTEFRTHFSDDERAFGYLRLQMGDEMSKRKKFMFMTWVGPNVSVINRAKMSTDKAIIKDIISNFAVELQLENQSEIDIDQFKDALNRAGGANYGTGVRDL